MTGQRSERTETAGLSRVEYLLGLLSDLSQSDPSPVLRGRLELLASQRLKDGTELGAMSKKTKSELPLWLKPVFVVVLLIVVGIVAALVIHARQPERLRAGIGWRVTSPYAPPDSGLHPQPASPSPEAELRKSRPPRLQAADNTSAQRMVVRLPYSDNAIATGTDATIQVSMSQAELVSLGFPISATLNDRRLVAELTLGDDGLPRAISVPLPLEVVREKK